MDTIEEILDKNPSDRGGFLMNRETLLWLKANRPFQKYGFEKHFNNEWTFMGLRIFTHTSVEHEEVYHITPEVISEATRLARAFDNTVSEIVAVLCGAADKSILEPTESDAFVWDTTTDQEAEEDSISLTALLT